MTVELSVKIGENSSLEKRIFCKVNTADDVTRLELKQVSYTIFDVFIKSYHDLLRLGEIIARISVKFQASDQLNWN